MESGRRGGRRYDLVVVGAGLTGSEAAFGAARGGLDVLLVTTSLDTVYMLAHSRAPLLAPDGSLLARLVPDLADERGMIERWELHRRAKYALEAERNIHLLQSNVTGLVVDGNRVTGVETWEGVPRFADRVVLTVGPFLGARLAQGALEEAAGRLGEMAYDELLHDLRRRGVELASASLTLDDPREGPPYRVDYSHLAPGAVAADGVVFGLEGLVADGVCARGYLSYEAAVGAGQALGYRLAVSSREDR